MLSRAMLTKAQRDALAVLAANDGKKLESWTRSSTMGHDAKFPLAPPRVNIRAVTKLCHLRLAAREIAPSWSWSPYVNHDKFQITELGLEVHSS